MMTKTLTDEDVEAVAEAVFHKISSLMSTKSNLSTSQRDTSPKKKGPKKVKALPRELRDSEVERLIQAAYVDNDRVPGGPYRDELVIRLGVDAGLRAAEMANLKWQNVDFESNKLRFFGKGSKERVVPLHPTLRGLLYEFHQTQGQPSQYEPVLSSRKGGHLTVRAIEHIVRRLAVNAGITERVHPHMLRHTFAHRWRENGGDSQALQKALGHASISTTLDIYGRISDDFVDVEFKKVLRSQVDKARDV